MTTGERIKKARIDRGLTQDDLAKALRTTKAAVSRYELNQRQLRVEQLNIIAKLTGVSVFELAGITSQKREELERVSQIASEFEERFLAGEYISESDAWTSEAINFLKYLIERELAAATSAPQADDAQDGESQDPDYKKRKRRMAKLAALFDQLNDAGQRSALDHLKNLSQINTFQRQPEQPTIFSGLTDDERTGLERAANLLREAKYDRFLMQESRELEDSAKMQANTELIASLNESIVKIVTAAMRRAEPSSNDRNALGRACPAKKKPAYVVAATRTVSTCQSYNPTHI